MFPIWCYESLNEIGVTGPLQGFLGCAWCTCCEGGPWTPLSTSPSRLVWHSDALRTQTPPSPLYEVDFRGCFTYSVAHVFNLLCSLDSPHLHDLLSLLLQPRFEHDVVLLFLFLLFFYFPLFFLVEGTSKGMNERYKNRSWVLRETYFEIWS